MTAPVLVAMLATLQPALLPPGNPAEAAELGTAFDPMASPIMQGDAELADVCFVDLQHGWAVGDRGTIWHTDDGGTHWHLQHSGVTCRLSSVSFVDSQAGWAGGGYSHPYTHSGTGVVLATRDGGRTWREVPHVGLPPLRQLRLVDQQRGWAIGSGSAMFPSGGFVTDDGARSFRPLSGRGTSSWLAGDLLGPTTGALAGRLGTSAMVRRGEIQPARIDDFGLRGVHRLQLVAPTHGWLVGDGGLVMRTDDLGATWQTPPGRPAAETLAEFDFRALAVRGPKCWIAGSPGTRVLHTPDAGQTWQSLPTPTAVPLSAIGFVDDEHGWAVGALGTILATRDGGRTWQRQRAGGSRAALLGLFASGPDVPLELFARLSGNEGYLGVVDLLTREDVELPGRAEVHPADRAAEALVAVGASAAEAAWRFPVRRADLRPTAEQILAGWDRANDGRGLAELEAHIVRQIRLWRPEVIVTHDAGPRGDDPLGHLLNQVVLAAVEKAADPTCYPRQITGAGLEPWGPRKVYASLPPPERGSTELPTAQWAARLGCSLADVAAMPRALLEDHFNEGPTTLGFRLLLHNMPGDQGRRDFFSGIILSPGGDARRELLQPPPGNLDQLRRIAQRRRNMEAILEQSDDGTQGGTQLLAQTNELIEGLDPLGAGRLLYHLAQQYRDRGRWSMAAETLGLLVDRYPEHPLARPALLWLVQYYASGEAAWRQQGTQRYAVRQASALSIDLGRQEDRPARAAELGRRIERTLPELFAQPSLRFPLAVANRNQGFPQQADRYYVARTYSSEHDAWWACAMGERWLGEPEGVPPKSILHCVRAMAKPRLDGRLDDALWQRAKIAQLKSRLDDDVDWPAAVMLAYDAEFLYLAVRCREAPGVEYEATEGPRPRDPDLASRDRVDVLLDLDRDFATYYRLSIDHRGWPAEDCWGDRTWDPTWFVAAETAEGIWTAEAAIPLDQLTGRYPGRRDVWALGIQRTVPGVGFQSFSTPAAAEVVPEGFAYLIFD